MKRRLSILFIFIITIFSIVGCSETETKKKDLMKENWDSILKKAKGETVNIHMWGGNVPVNKYIDKWVSPQLKEQFDITLNRVPINDAKDMINKLLTEKEVNKTDGSIDIFWINGENFKNSKDNGLLWGSFAEKLPNYNKYVDKNAEDIKYDFGELTEGMEVPWGKSQFVLIYDSEKIKNPPINMLKLKEWVKKNKGKFTYPAPPDFTGSAFIRQVLYEETGGYEKYLQSMNANEFIKEAKPLWNYLNEIKPFLWREGKTYPESSGKLDRLYGNGEVWMTMSYNPVHAENKIKSGQFPVSSKTFLLDDGTLSNTHYLSIPFNAKSKAGAMVVIDFLISPEAQITKYDPEYWGDGLVIMPEKLNNENRNLLNSIDRGESTLSSEELKSKRVPEISSKYIDILEEEWIENVAK